LLAKIGSDGICEAALWQPPTQLAKSAAPIPNCIHARMILVQTKKQSFEFCIGTFPRELQKYNLNVCSYILNAKEN